MARIAILLQQSFFLDKTQLLRIVSILDLKFLATISGAESDHVTTSIGLFVSRSPSFET